MAKTSRKLRASKTSPKGQVRSFSWYLAKAFYASPEDLAERIPELQPLREKTIAVFGLGCLGAHSVLEFARGGVGHLRLADYDTVDPAAAVRWPIGLVAAGAKKAQVLRDVVRYHYPYTEPVAFDFRIGRVRTFDSDLPSDQSQIESIMRGVDLIYDSTAELGVQHFLTDYAWDRRIAYVGISGTLGGWGGQVYRIRQHPGGGCWFCYRLACEDNTIPEPPSAPQDEGTVQPTGCADPTFTGAGFDMLEVAVAGVRMAVSTLCEGTTNTYPSTSWDVTHIHLRDENGALIAPAFETYNINPHPRCSRSHGSSE